MWVEKRKNGYTFRERYKHPLTGKMQNVSVTYPDKKRQTQAMARTALQEKVKRELSRITVPQRLTFRKLCDMYVEWQYESLKEQTANNTEGKVNVLCRLIGPELAVESLSAWYVREQLKTEKACTYNDRLKVFKAMMRWAYANDLIENISFVQKLQRRKDAPARIKDKDKYLEHEEIDALLRESNDTYRMLTKFLLLSGLRIGEAIALEARHVDMKARTITVEQSWSLRIGGISSVKTDCSCRTIYMQDELLECVKEINAYREDLGKKKKRVLRMFFPMQYCDHISYDAYRKYLRITSQKAIGRVISPHALRHTHTALLAEAGIPLQDISHRLGHSNSKVTNEVYMHVNKSLREKENERLKAVKML